MLRKPISKIFRYTGDFKGKQRIYRYLDFIFRLFSERIVENVDGVWYNLNTRDLIQRSVLYEGGYENDLVEQIVNICDKKESGTLWDVGANIGSVVLPVLSKTEGWSAVCFEPSPKIVSKLHANVSLNVDMKDDITIIQAALGDRQGFTDFFVSNESENTGVGSMMLSHNNSNKSIKVYCSTGAKIKTKKVADIPDIVKIDVEGFELEVLRGMGRILEQNDMALILEYEPYRLQERGYSIEKINSLLSEYQFDISYISSSNRVDNLPKYSARGTLVATKGMLSN